MVVVSFIRRYSLSVRAYLTRHLALVLSIPKITATMNNKDAGRRVFLILSLSSLRRPCYTVVGSCTVHKLKDVPRYYTVDESMNESECRKDGLVALLVTGLSKELFPQKGPRIPTINAE